MKKIRLSDKIILVYRIGVVALTLFTIIAGWSISAIESGIPFVWLSGLKYYTIQTNLMVSAWFILAIMWYKKPEALKKITGLLKGAFTLYITTTFIFFAVLLQGLYQPTGFGAFSNIILHYLTPIAFIVDWLITETKVRYKWKFLPYWTIYPLGYLLFSFIHGSFTGDYLYLFLNINNLGILGYTISISLLIGVGLIIGSLYIGINRIRTKN
ncbi:MAG: Pr6Pr family membrane protein [Candidatus Lokiarchaeota archaeon]|nr:Pr6Pr family membrane protein [Candidatus Lokiarchaeota archaeon]